jgi:hypothetical protein
MDNLAEFYKDIFSRPSLKAELTKTLNNYEASHAYFTDIPNAFIKDLDPGELEPEGLEEEMGEVWAHRWNGNANEVGLSNKMLGADPAAYPPDGSWHAVLYEIFGWYYWQEPEGEEYGLFKTKKEAVKFGARNWCQ